jgi:iron(III) transport system substrate-binding protein
MEPTDLPSALTKDFAQFHCLDAGRRLYSRLIQFFHNVPKVRALSAAVILLAMSLWGSSLHFVADAQERPPAVKTIDEAKKEGQLALYGAFTGGLQGTPEGKRFLDRFREKYPFIELKLTSLSGIRLMPRIANEYRAGQYLVDIIATSGAYVHPLVKAGLMGKYLSPERAGIPNGFKDPDGHWTSWFLPVYSVAYNTKLVAAQDVPRTYADLLSPKWHGHKVQLLESNMLRWLVGESERIGRDKTLAFLKRLAGQQPLFKSGGGATLEAQLLAAGEFPVMFTTTLHSIIELQERGAPVDWVRMKEPLLTFPSLIGIAARAPHSNAAKLYCDYVLSEEGQKLLSPSVRIPARRGVETTPPQLIKDLELFPVSPQGFDNFKEDQQLIRKLFGS